MTQPGTPEFSEAIDPDANKVVRRLLAAGHEAYLVGGCVRDLFLGRRPKDFDIATSATPEAIRRLFRNSRVIGRRFKLAHVFFGPKIIETSTFRTAPQPNANDEDPLITHDNEWGSVEDDARRRDFTINGLFYDVETERIVDFVDGIDDLEARLIRTIGDPTTRFKEDPVRMIRAVKFAARLSFSFEPDTWAALLDVAPDIVKCSRARLLEEIYKLMRGGAARRSFELLLETGLFESVLGPYLKLFGPDAAERLLTAARPGTHPQGSLEPAHLLWKLLAGLDAYVAQTDELVHNGVLLAVMFAPLIGRDLAGGSRQGLDRTLDSMMSGVGGTVGLARRDRELARQILMAHRRLLEPGTRRRRPATAHRQYFHDALVFLGLWVEALGDGGSELALWRKLATTGEAPDPAAQGQRKRKRRPNRRRGGGGKERTEAAQEGLASARPSET
jgi:poly(A) polymerase